MGVDGTELAGTSGDGSIQRADTNATGENSSDWLRDTLLSFNRMSEFKQDKKNYGFDVTYQLHELITSGNDSLVSDEAILSDFLSQNVSRSPNREALLSEIIPEADNGLFGLKPTEIKAELERRKEEFVRSEGYKRGYEEWPYDFDYVEGKHFYLSVPANIRGASYVIDVGRGEGGTVSTSESIDFKYTYQEESVGAKQLTT